MTVNIFLYTRPGCNLCDEIKEHITEIGRSVALNLTEIDITADPALESQFHDRIPVVEIGDKQFEAPLDTETLTKAILKTSGLKRVKPLGEPSSIKTSKTNVAIDRVILWFARHWVVVISLIIGLYAGIPFLAPVAMHAGMTGLGTAIYKIYSPMCHQFAFRSWFLYGDSHVYPRGRANVDLPSFEEYAAYEPAFDGIDLNTLDADLIYVAKQFYGSERMGWKVAFCQRDIAIYGSITLFGLLFILLKGIGIKMPTLPFWAYILIALVPVGLDGGTQFLANPPFNGLGLSFLSVRESTPAIRVITGSLFGIGNAWLAYPYIEESMQETIELIESKLIKVGVMTSRG
nr:glutaredoxin family protein [Anaerolineae bacterium]